MNYQIESMGQGFKVVQQKVTVRALTCTPNGGLSTTHLEAGEVFKGYDYTLLYAWYNGEKDWTCDVDCGCQRWRGHKNTAQLRAALKKLGFDKDTIRQTIKGATCPGK